ncbi:RTA1 like protein-domain-containing protein [Mycena leptocephala]|nr:RTA1 like protein-domain-containing protein [Mycena leptocephala]
MYSTLRTTLILVFFATAGTATAAEIRSESVVPSATDTQYLGGYKPKRSLAVLAAFLWALSPHFHVFRELTGTFLPQATLIYQRRLVEMWPPEVHDNVDNGNVRIRSVYINFPRSEALFIAMNEVTLLSPCFFFIVTYVLFSRLVSTFDQEVTQRCLPVRASRITPIFVGTTFLFAAVEAAGVALTAVKGSTTQNIGNKVALLAIGFQFFFIELFMLVLFIFRHRMRRDFPLLWHSKDAPRFTIWGRTPIAWQTVFYILAVTSTVLLLRSVYRIVEFSLGQNGYLIQHEVFLYCFDALPLWLAMSIYCIVWPTRALVLRPTYQTSSQIPLDPVQRV